MIRNFLNQYFSFSRAEKNGTLVLVVLIIFVLAGYFILPKIIVNRSIDFTDFKNEIEVFEQLISSTEDDVLSLKNGEKTFENMDDIQFFEFDPNDLSVDKWKHLGLSEKAINTIRKYLKKGGRFYKPEDIKKIYGLKIDWYKLAEPYIKIREIDATDIKTGARVIVNEKKAALIELNSADSLLLTDLRGIGPVLAGRILKYRNLLGGFVRKDQLLEVYGLAYETFENISQAVIIDTTGITRIDLNKAAYTKLIRHPYLDVYTVKGILNYRDIQGNIKDVNELKDNRIIPEENFSRIKPYIVVSIEESN
jgi:DNA uptake protein ComE-like DNA-binding protein